MFDDPSAITEYEREREKWQPETARPATTTRTKIGCAKVIFYLVAGIALIKLIGDFLMITGGN